MLSDTALGLVMAHPDCFKRKSFLESFADNELIEALTWFRENKPIHSRRRQMVIEGYADYIEDMSKRMGRVLGHKFLVADDHWEKDPEK